MLSPTCRASQVADEYYARLRIALGSGPPMGLASFVEELYACARRGGIIFTLGNGASAALASHMACDLSKGTSVDLGLAPSSLPAMRVRAVSLADNTAVLSAYGNDLSFDLVFVEQLKTLLAPWDLVVAISASGGSRNVLCALEYARAAGARTVGITGMMVSAAQTVERCDVVVQVPADEIEIIEDLHVPLHHAAMKMLAARLRPLRQAVLAGNSDQLDGLALPETESAPDPAVQAVREGTTSH